MNRSSVLAAVLFAALLVVPAAAAQAPGTCPPGFTCSKVTVPLDRSGAVPGTIDLFVARHRASAGAGKPAFIALTGGPGQAAVPFAADAAKRLRPALGRYQFVAFDQRGTGASGAIDCPELQMQDETPDPDAAARAAAACGARLGAAAGAYPTAATVEDIEAVRQAVGAEKVALIGVSYGTHVIQRYLLAHPDRVDRVILDSTVEPGGVDLFQRDSFGATTRILGEICPPRACPVRDLPGTVRAVVAAAGERPFQGRVVGADGRVRRSTVNGADIFGALVNGDLNPFLRAQFAASVGAARAGDTAPLLRMKAIGEASPPSAPEELSNGLNIATLCTDVRLPWAPSSDLATRPALFDAAVAALDPATLGAFDVPTARETSVALPCLGWPPVSTQPDTLPDAYAAVPALILDGRADVRTPIESARKVAAKLPGAQVVTVAGTGHDVLDSDETGCAARALNRFLADQPVGDPCRGRTNAPTPRPAFPRRLDQLDGRTRRDRILEAVAATVDDASATAVTYALQGAPLRFGGLRGGRVVGALAGSGLTVNLTRYVYLPGLRVSGRSTARHTDVRFSGLATGRLEIRGRKVTAVVDGRPITVRRS